MLITTEFTIRNNLRSLFQKIFLQTLGVHSSQGKEFHRNMCSPPFSALAAPANTLVSLCLQLMKATVLAEGSIFYLFVGVLPAPAMSTDVSQVRVALLPSF